MSGIEKIIEQMKSEPANIRFVDLQKVCETLFGKARNWGGSHFIYKSPWRWRVRQPVCRTAFFVLACGHAGKSIAWDA